MTPKLTMNDEQLQHFLRNPYGTSVEHQREIRLQAADRIEALKKMNEAVQVWTATQVKL